VGSAGAPLTGRAIGAQAITAAIAGWLSVVLASLACALEMAISGAAAAADVVPAMVGIHALIGLPEASITALAATSLAYFPSQAASPRNNVWRGGRSAAVSAVALAPFASSLPDGLERIADSFVTGTNSAANLPSLFSDYALPGVPSPFAATALAGVLGMLMVYVFCRIVFSTGLRHPSAGG
jgi:cobalt/nickel transport system permease protein